MNPETKKFPVAIASSSPSWGGLEMQTLISARELAGRGYRVHMLTGRNTVLEREALAVGLNVAPILTGRSLSPLAVLSVARYLTQNGIEIVHSELARDLWVIVPAARAAGGIPALLTMGMQSSVNKKDPFHRSLYRYLSHVFCVSDVVRKNMLKRYPVRDDQLLVIPRGVELERYTEARSVRKETRRELGLGENDLGVVHAGRISRGKGQLEFLRAIESVAEHVPRARFFLVGGITAGEEVYGREVEKLAARLALGDRLRFTGHRSDMPEVLAAADLLVVPSASEAGGNMVIEAMAAGLAVAAAGSASFLELVVDGETGLLFSLDDPGELASVMERMLVDRPLRESMSVAARRRAEEHYDRAGRTDITEEIYAGLVSQ